LASDASLNSKSDEQKLDMFGPFFHQFPSQFEFLTGEKDRIIAAGTTARELLLQYDVDVDRCRKRKENNNNLKNESEQVNNLPAPTQSRNNTAGSSAISENENSVNVNSVTKKTVKEIIENGFAKNLYVCVSDKSFKMNKCVNGEPRPRVFFKHLLDHL